MAVIHQLYFVVGTQILQKTNRLTIGSGGTWGHWGDPRKYRGGLLSVKRRQLKPSLLLPEPVKQKTKLK